EERVVHGADPPQPRRILDEVRERAGRALPDDDRGPMLRERRIETGTDRTKVAVGAGGGDVPVRRQRTRDKRRESTFASAAVPASIAVPEEENRSRRDHTTLPDARGCARAHARRRQRTVRRRLTTARSS